MTEKPMDAKGAALAIFLCLLFGSNALAIKLSLFGLSPYTCVMLRFLVASLIILAYARFKKIPLALSAPEWGHATAMGIIFGLQMAVFYVGITYTTVSHAGVLMNTQPFFVAIMAHFLLPDDRLTLRKISGIVLAFIGVSILFSRHGAMDSGSLLGDALIMGSSFLWAAQTIYIKRFTDHWDSIPLVLHPMVLSIFIFLVFYLIFEIHTVQVINTTVLISLLYQSVIVAGYGYIGWTKLLLRYKATHLSVFVFIMPIVAVSLGIIFMGDPFSTKLLVSLVLVAAGILVVNIVPKEAFVVPE
jgi:drug/metabolite transporter (DMT)-like permease